MKRIFGPYPPSPEPEVQKPQQPEAAPEERQKQTPAVRSMGTLRMVTRAHRERLARILAAQANAGEQEGNSAPE